MQYENNENKRAELCRKCWLLITRSLLRLSHRLPIEVRHYFFKLFLPTDRNCRWINNRHQPSNSAVLEAAKELWNFRSYMGRAGAMGARVSFDGSNSFSKLQLDIKTQLTAWCCCVKTLSYECRASIEWCSVVFWIILSDTFAWNIAVAPVARLVFCSIPASQHISLTIFPKAFLPIGKFWNHCSSEFSGGELFDRR